MKLQPLNDQENMMSDDLDSENNNRNKLADAIFNDLINIAKSQGNPIKKMKADKNGVFYIEKEISVDEFLDQA